MILLLLNMMSKPMNWLLLVKIRILSFLN